jgi:hypothetical protein
VANVRRTDDRDGLDVHSMPSLAFAAIARCWTRWRFAGSDVVFGRQFVEVTARFHPFVEDADDLDHPVTGAGLLTLLPSTERRVYRRWKLRISERSSGRFVVSGPSGSAATCRIAAARAAAYRCRLSAPQRSALMERMLARSICAGRARRNRAILRKCLADSPHGGGCEAFEVAYEIRVVDLSEFAAIDRMNAGLDLRSERPQTEAVFLPALLEHTQRISNCLACILVFASLHDLLDEGVLLGRQESLSWTLAVPVWPASSYVDRG